MSHKTNAAGVALIKRWEGKRLTAYQDSVGVWTIGYGHTSAAGAPKVAAGLKITDAEAEDILRRDLGQYEDAVAGAVKVPLTGNQFGALVSFTYNLGAANFRSSMLLKKLNASDYAAVPAEMLKWNKAGGKVLAGLTNRRKDEVALWRTADAAAPDEPLDPVLTAPTPPPAAEPAVSFWARLWAALTGRA